MAGKWEGFTEDDIQNLNNSKSTLSSCKPSNSYTPVNKHINKQNRYARKNVARERILQGSKYYSNSKNTSEIPNEARLYIPQSIYEHGGEKKKRQVVDLLENKYLDFEIPEEEEEEEMEVTVSNRKSDSAHLEQKEKVENKVRDLEKIAVTDSAKPVKHLLSSKNESILFSNNMDIAALEEFEERQKKIKEQNRLRKEFLKKTIEDRTKKTHAEARRLHQIEGELKKLDDQLITDVAILRDQIESASLEFMEAQKRFDLSEREYLDAKLSLFNKKERKELLTSHLCTIIEHNELRKAKKLSELMEKLEIGSPSSNFLVTQLSTGEQDFKNSQIEVITCNPETSIEVSSTKNEKCIEKEENKQTNAM